MLSAGPSFTNEETEADRGSKQITRVARNKADLLRPPLLGHGCGSNHDGTFIGHYRTGFHW